MKDGKWARRAGYTERWYVFDFRAREFLRHSEANAGRHATMGPLYAVWTPGIRHAKRFSNPSIARRTANRINLERGRNDCGTVTSAAAECLNLINMRDGLPRGGEV